jgi:hypothetical protein
MYSVEIKNNKEIYDFCMVNGIVDINKFIQDCFKQGFDIKKYGFLGEQEKRVEIPVEVIKYVDREVIKEVKVEIPVEKIVTIYDKIDNPELLLKIQQLENEISNKDKEIELFKKNQESQKNVIQEKDNQIVEYKKIVRKQRVFKFIGFGTGTIGLAAVVLILL